MVTQKIQTSMNVKGFTLVELIVVITILVILGTIAFLNLGGMSASARDSQRTSDLNQINQQVMVKQAKDGTSYMNMVSYSGTNSLTGGYLAGAAINGTSYTGGEVNYTLLGIDAAKFKDPSSGSKYRIAATTTAGSSYEIAASLEETLTALVIGTYRARGDTGSSAGTSTATGTLTITLGAVDIGKFLIWDTLLDGGAITSLINTTNGVIIGTTSQVNTTGAVALAGADVGGLIADKGANKTKAVTNKGTNLPY